jgi:hypothetical protein
MPSRQPGHPPDAIMLTPEPGAVFSPEALSLVREFAGQTGLRASRIVGNIGDFVLEDLSATEATQLPDHPLLVTDKKLIELTATSNIDQTLVRRGLNACRNNGIYYPYVIEGVASSRDQFDRFYLPHYFYEPDELDAEMVELAESYDIELDEGLQRFGFDENVSPNNEVRWELLYKIGKTAKLDVGSLVALAKSDKLTDIKRIGPNVIAALKALCILVEQIPPQVGPERSSS